MFFTRPSLKSCSMYFSPSPSISMALREAKWMIDSRICAGQESPMQRTATSPGIFTTSQPHSGHSAGIGNGFSRPVRFSVRTFTTAGITSPARSTTTVSPIRISFRSISSQL